MDAKASLKAILSCARDKARRIEVLWIDESAPQSVRNPHRRGVAMAHRTGHPPRHDAGRGRGAERPAVQALRLRLRLRRHHAGLERRRAGDAGRRLHPADAALHHAYRAPTMPASMAKSAASCRTMRGCGRRRRWWMRWGCGLGNEGLPITVMPGLDPGIHDFPE